MAETHAEFTPHHRLPQQTGTEGIWTVWRYRDAKIRTHGVSAYLHLAGHPYDGLTGFSFELAVAFTDAWLDRGELPRGYLMPKRRPH